MDSNKKYYLILITIIFFHIQILFNIKFTAWPEMFSFPYLFNNGFNLYKDMIHPYTPLLTITLSYLFKIFGYNVLVVKIFTYLLIILNDLIIFKITTKFTKKESSGLLAVLFYSLSQPFLDGNQLWFDFAITTPILFGVWLLISGKYFLSGILMALAFLIKQNSFLFFVLGLLFIVIKNKQIKEAISYALGAGMTVLPLFVYLLYNNSIFDFFNWVLIYPSKYWTAFPDYVQLLPNLRQAVIIAVIFIPVIFLVLKDKFKTKNISLILSSLLVSIILIYPRFSFFHFQVGIAILSILFAISASKLNKPKYIVFYLLILLLITKKEWGYTNRFIDDNKLEVAKNEKIYLIGIHSLNYVISRSLPTKPWIDNYGWYFEMPNMQEKVLDSWKSQSPSYIYLSKPMEGQWYDLGTYQPKRIVEYIRENYTKVDEINDVEVWKLK